MVSSGSLGSDFTIPRTDGWWEGVKRAQAQGRGCDGDVAR